MHPPITKGGQRGGNTKIRNLESEFYLNGYEIHMGRTTGDIGLFRLSRITHHASLVTVVMDGSLKGNVWGTYIHGIFDNDRFRRELLNSLRLRKGLAPVEDAINYSELKENAINKWAQIIKNNVDICFILRLLDMEYCKEYLLSTKHKLS